MSNPAHPPTVGSAVLLASGPGGWEPQSLLFASPLVLLRFRGGVTRLFAADASEPFFVREAEPLLVLEEVFAGLRAHLPAASDRAPKPAFPVAMVAASYEFGRRFAPHEAAFAQAGKLEHDEFFAAVFIDAFRPDRHGGTERLGYAGSIPAGWMAGAPELQSSPYGHDAPPIFPHPVAGKASAPLGPLISAEAHAAGIERIKEYLRAGDIYQANLTFALQGETAAPPELIFDVGLARGGASFGGMMVLPEATLISFSPELYLRRRGTRIETRPIKGTRAIPAHMGGAATAREQLLSDAKDRAEHIMIVDLERNDLGRVCLPGSVVADPLMNVVEHPTVMHLESTVKGTLRPGMGMADLFAATFPGGSVTGAPKKRAIEVLSELETEPRGWYCGAFGWIDCLGDCDLNLPIRTAVVRPDGRVDLRVGGGIVADSDPAAEWNEALDKARFFEGVLAAAQAKLQPPE